MVNWLINSCDVDSHLRIYIPDKALANLSTEGWFLSSKGKKPVKICRSCHDDYLCCVEIVGFWPLSRKHKRQLFCLRLSFPDRLGRSDKYRVHDFVETDYIIVLICFEQ